MKIALSTRFILFAIPVMLFNCNSVDDTVIETPIDNIMNIVVNGEPFEVINENVFGNENCDFLSKNPKGMA